MPTQVAIHGAAGRMGRRLIALGHADPEINLIAAIERAGADVLGQDAGVLAGIGEIGLRLAPEWPQRADAVIDFSVPEAVEGVVAKSLEHKLPLVLATTGFGPEVAEQIRAAAKQIPLCWAPSMSMTVNLTMKLVEIAGRALRDHPSGADVEIIERHHRFKEDSPSGTALAFGRIVADAMGQTTTRTDAKVGPALDRITKSATTPCGRAITRASTPSSSGCWAKRSNCAWRRATATATPKAPWWRPAGCKESRPACMTCRMCWV